MLTARLGVGALLAAIVLPCLTSADTGEEISFFLAADTQRCFRHAAHGDTAIVGEILVIDGIVPDVRVDLSVEDMSTSRIVLQRAGVDHEKFTLNDDASVKRHAENADPQAIPPRASGVGDGAHGRAEALGDGAAASGRVGHISDRLVDYRICVSARHTSAARAAHQDRDPHQHQSLGPHSGEPARKVLLSFRSATDAGYLDHVSPEHVRDLVSRKTDLNTLKSVALQIEASVRRITRGIDDMRARENRMFAVVSRSADEIFWYSISSCVAIVLAGIFISSHTHGVLKTATR
jgi:emp24/gp25L/p24 family/GOLD